ncbi:bifunctional oligoribonuclease/PAP phosphatase NrnA [bacterium]|nr:bifunctional oligoribonuclease/PAP phosphatase NrnA [bacterium]
MNQNNTYAEIAAEIRRFKKLFLTTHRNPEGDAIGSSLALGNALKSLGHTFRFSLDDGVPHPIDLMSGTACAEQNIEPTPDELVIVLDCPNKDRISSSFKKMDRREHVINLDHHLENSYFGQYNYVDSVACATGEIVYFLLKEMGLTIDVQTASFLYMAILTDTGAFCFANTNKNAFMISTELIGCGLDPHYVAQIVYENYSLSKMRLLGHALSSLEISDDGQIGWITITREILARFNSSKSDLEGFVNYPRYIEGVLVSVFFHEIDDKRVKVSFRSKGEANVAEFAKQWGGGGHKNAAACLIDASLSEAKALILESLLPAMQKMSLHYNDK